LRTGGSFEPNLTGHAEGLLSSTLRLLLPVQDGDRCARGDPLFIVAMEFAQPQEFRLHQDQRPDGRNAHRPVPNDSGQ
jgi:hypothetical protein